MTSRSLVIGYGNPLRRDDGFGWHAGAELARSRRPPGCTVLVRHQLTPELVTDVAEAGLVVLIDARQGDGLPGEIMTRRVYPSPAQEHTWSHHLGPSVLLGLTKTLYVTAPQTFMITATGASFGYSEGLSPVLQRALPEVVGLVHTLLTTAETPPASEQPGRSAW